MLHIPSGQKVEMGEPILWNHQDIRVYYEPKQIVSLTVYNEDYATNRGVKVGDSLEKIKMLYGEPARFGEDEYKWLSYHQSDESFLINIHFYLDKKN